MGHASAPFVQAHVTVDFAQKRSIFENTRNEHRSTSALTGSVLSVEAIESPTLPKYIPQKPRRQRNFALQLSRALTNHVHHRKHPHPTFDTWRNRCSRQRSLLRRPQIPHSDGDRSIKAGWWTTVRQTRAKLRGQAWEGRWRRMSTFDLVKVGNRLWG